MRQPRVLNRRLSRLLRMYYRGPDHPMKLRLWYALRRAFGYPRITMPYASQGWITVTETDHLQGQIFAQGDYEPEVWSALAELAVADEIFWDVGANIGSVSVKALTDGRIKQVHAFEPDPLHAVILRHNLRLNRGEYAVHQLALSDRAERRTLSHGPGANTGLSTLVHSALATDTQFEVECRTVDDLVMDGTVPAPTLMKIDVEGWENAVLRGSRRVLAEATPRAIVFEAECDPQAVMLDNEPLDLLREYHYDVSHLPRQGGWIEPRENYLAVRSGAAR